MQATIQYIEKELGLLYPKSEIDGFVRLIFESVCFMSYTEQILQNNKKIDSSYFEKIAAIVLRLKTFEPIQYILGKTVFYDLTLRVNSSVLIPRPETEELVHWILESNKTVRPKILDIGTGSGCIALVLKNGIKDAEIGGVDISAEALAVAKENAIQNQLEVDFFQVDILNWEKYKWDLFDIIVSNPPYVLASEKRLMDPNVLDYEPEGALFVPDTDPLLFYRRIAGFAKKHLDTNGKLFFEINESMGKEMCSLLSSMGFKDIQLRKDINGKKRMLRASR